MDNRKYKYKIKSLLPFFSNLCSVGYSRTGGVNTWHYDAKNCAVVVQTTMLPTNANVVVQIVVSTSGPSLIGLKVH